MREYRPKDYLIPAAQIFVGVPLLLWAVGDFPRRTVLKEALSLLFILAFCQMLGQFFLARGNTRAVKSLNMSTAVKFHKAIGYIAVALLLVHPFLLVVPRYFESGVEPMEAFVTIITTFNSRGIVLGLAAWSVMLILGITSLFRKRLPMKHTTWRVFHGIMSMLLIGLATWHAVNLGRHTDQAMSIYMILLAGGGILLLIKTYVMKPAHKREVASQ